MKPSGLGDSPLFLKSSVVNKTQKKLEPPKNVSQKVDQGKEDKKENKISYPKELINCIRKRVKETGKEATTHRLSINERKALLEIVYHYKLQGIRTNENEIARIALNFLIQDYKERKQDSLLARVIAALND